MACVQLTGTPSSPAWRAAPCGPGTASQSANCATFGRKHVSMMVEPGFKIRDHLLSHPRKARARYVAARAKEREGALQRAVHSARGTARVSHGRKQPRTAAIAPVAVLHQDAPPEAARPRLDQLGPPRDIVLSAAAIELYGVETKLEQSQHIPIVTHVATIRRPTIRADAIVPIPAHEEPKRVSAIHHRGHVREALRVDPGTSICAVVAICARLPTIIQTSVAVAKVKQRNATLT